MRPFPLLGSVLVFGLSTVMAHAAGASTASRTQPLDALLPAVEPAWRERGWRAVMPHAYVVRKLLAVRTGPTASSPVAFHLKGGTRVPVLEQGQTWWRIGWTQGRHGWVRVSDVEPHAAFVLLDTRTGHMQRRIAAKGQWGAVSDGQHLWSVADTGITRTSLGARPEFWSRNVAADRDALFPEWSLWSPERSHFYLRAAGQDSGTLLRTEVRTGEVRSLGTPPSGELKGLTTRGELLLLDTTGGKHRTRVYSPQAGRALHQQPAGVQVVSRSGISYLQQGEELIRSGPDLRTTARVRLPTEAVGVCLSTDERYLAASYELPKGDESQTQVRIMDAGTLRTVTTLAVPPDTYCPYIHHFGKWSGGWWIAASGEARSEAVIRYRKNGKVLHTYLGDGPSAVNAPGTTVYLTGEAQVAAIDTATGRRRTMPFSWRRELPARYLPKPTTPEFPVHLTVSSLTLTPDGKTLILTEWLNGDPEG